MNNDLISREALKKAISEKLGIYIDGTLNNRLLFGIIDNTPTVEPCKDCEDKRQAEYIRHGSSWHELQSLRKFKEEHERPQGDWIPVSERLPEYSGLYLISIYDLVTVANFTGKHFCDRQMDKFVDVFAWQPLPKPYKKGGAE